MLFGEKGLPPRWQIFRKFMHWTNSIWAPTHFAEFIKALNPIFKKFGVSKFNDGQNISIFFTPIFLFNRYKLLWQKLYCFTCNWMDHFSTIVKMQSFMEISAKFWKRQIFHEKNIFCECTIKSFFFNPNPIVCIAWQINAHKWQTFEWIIVAKSD